MDCGPATRYAFTPEDIARLQAAFRETLVEIKGRKEWRRLLGKDLLSVVAARAIVASAASGVRNVAELQELALRAVKVQYLRALH